MVNVNLNEHGDIAGTDPFSNNINNKSNNLNSTLNSSGSSSNINNSSVNNGNAGRVDGKK